jgi:micrococcal nuclease
VQNRLAWLRVPLLGVTVLALAGCGSQAGPPRPTPTSQPSVEIPSPVEPQASIPASFPPVDATDGIPATVIRVVDGDTLHARIDGKDEKVRVIGMDSPEVAKPDTPVECFAREASRAAERLLRKGDRITIQPDPTQDTRDRFGRLLAHVLLADGTLFAETMIRHGWAVHYVYDGVPSIYAERLQAAQDAAKADQAGLWSPKTCNGDPHLSSTAP